MVCRCNQVQGVKVRLCISKILMGVLIVGVWSSQASARLDYNVSRVMVLYDASRSMYPGYSIDEPANPRIPYFHERIEFLEWLLNFMASQGDKFGARGIELDAFYNVGQQPNVRIEMLHRFDSAEELRSLTSSREGVERSKGFFSAVAKAYGNPAVGQRTYLLEALSQVSSGFDGIVWLITDNIVDEGRRVEGRDNLDVTDLNGLFFHLRDDPRYRSVHVFSYPYRMDGRTGTLAVYGLLVSSDEPEESVLESLDSRFFDMGDAFPGGKHLKLRDLNISPLIYSPVFTVHLMNDESFFGSEGHRLDIDHAATIKSNLTQHSVVSGVYTVFAGELRPTDEEAVAAYSLEPLPSGLLGESQGELPVLAPLGSVTIAGTLSGREAVHLKGMSLLSRLKWAMAGEPIKYEGDIHVQFRRLGLNVEPQRLDEVYGMSRAPAVFGIHSGITSLADQQATRHIVIFVSPPSALGWILLVPLLVALAGVGFLSWLLLRSSNYRVTKSGDATIVPLRPFGVYAVRHDDLPIGRLRRGLSKDFTFVAAREAGLQVEELAEPGSYRAVLPPSGEEKKVVSLKIESLDGGKARKVAATGGDKAGPDPRSLPGGGRNVSPPPPKFRPPGSR